MASTKCYTNGSHLAAFLRKSYEETRGEHASSSSGPLSIRIDDRRSTDVSPDFCSLSVLIQDAAVPRFTLYLKNPPLDDEMSELIYDKDGKTTGSRPDLHVEIPVLTKEVGFLRQLAKAFRRIVGGGRTYPNANWKWVCRRTGDSLDHFADRLMEYRRLRKHTPWHLSTASSAVDVGSAASGPPTDCLGIGTTTQANQVDEEDIFRRLEMG